MWFRLRGSLRFAPGYAAEAKEMLISTSRKLIIGVSAVHINLQLLIAVTLNNPKAIDLSLLTTPVILLVGYLAGKMLPRQTALLIWQAGITVAITIFLRGFQ